MQDPSISFEFQEPRVNIYEDPQVAEEQTIENDSNDDPNLNSHMEDKINEIFERIFHNMEQAWAKPALSAKFAPGL